jgi:hypothetical protein
MCSSAVADAVAAAATAMVGDIAMAAGATTDSLVTTLSINEPPEGSIDIPSQMVIKLPEVLDPANVKTQLSAVPGVQVVVQNIVTRISQSES